MDGLYRARTYYFPSCLSHTCMLLQPAPSRSPCNVTHFTHPPACVRPHHEWLLSQNTRNRCRSTSPCRGTNREPPTTLEGEIKQPHCRCVPFTAVLFRCCPLLPQRSFPSLPMAWWRCRWCDRFAARQVVIHKRRAASDEREAKCIRCASARPVSRRAGWMEHI